MQHNRGFSKGASHGRHFSVDVGPASAASMPSLRRSHRQVLQTMSAINVRMRTVEMGTSLLDSGVDSQDLSESEQYRILLSVEVENNSETGWGFQMDEVALELGSPTTLAIETTSRKKPMSFDSQSWPITLQRSDQYDLLFEINMHDISTTLSTNASAHPATVVTPQPVPKSATLSPSQAFSRRHLSGKAPDEAAETPIRRPLPTLAPPKASRRREITIVVTGCPVPLQTVTSSSRAVPAMPFSSRWVCSLDLSAIVGRVNERKHISSVLDSVSPRSSLRQPNDRNSVASSLKDRFSMLSPPATGPSENIAGNKRFSIAGLASMMADTFSPIDLISERRSSLPPIAHRSQTIQGLPDGDVRPALAPSGDRRIVSAPNFALDNHAHIIPPAEHPSALTPTSNDLESPLPTPAYPPHSSRRPYAQIVQPVEATSASYFSNMSTNRAIARSDRPRESMPSESTGVLVSVSVIRLREDTDATPAATFAQNTPLLPTSAQMRKTLSALSSTAPEETIPHHDQSDGRRSTHVNVLDVFLLEVFIMNRSDTERSFVVGIPHRKAREAVPYKPVKLGLGLNQQGEFLLLQVIHHADIASYVVTPSVAPEADGSGLVALENNVTVGCVNMLS